MSHEDSGFKVVQLKHRSDRSTWHQIFIRQHKNKLLNEEYPDGKTLYIINIPPYINEEHIIFGYKSAGTIEQIIFKSSSSKQSKINDSTENSDQSNKPILPSITTNNNLFRQQTPYDNTFKSAYVIFKTSKSLRKSLQQNEIHLFEHGKTIITEIGLNKWMKEYLDSHLNEIELENDVEGFLTIFDETEKIAQEQEQEQQAEEAAAPDNDGWTIVKKGKHGGFAQTERILSRLNAKIENGQQKKELKNFYKFQKQNDKKAQIGKLRKRFTADRKAIEDRKMSKKNN